MVEAMKMAKLAYDNDEVPVGEIVVKNEKIIGRGFNQVITKNSVSSIRNKSYWNYNNLNPKDPVALNLFSQKDLIEAIEKAERRIKREKKEKEKAKAKLAQ